MSNNKPHTLCAFFRPFQHLLVLLVRTVNALILTYSIFSLGLPLQWLEVDWKIPPWSQRLLCVLYFEFQNKLYDYYDNITEDSKKPRSIISAEPLPVKLYICRSNVLLNEDWVPINLFSAILQVNCCIMPILVFPMCHDNLLLTCLLF